MFLLTIIIFFFLTFVTAYEVALQSSSIANIYSYYSGNSKLKRVLQIKKNITYSLGVFLIYDIFFSNMFSILCNSIISQKLEGKWRALVVPLVAFIVVFWEFLVKTYVRENAEFFVYFFCSIAEKLIFIAGPVALLLNKVVSLLLYFTKKKGQKNENNSLKEIRNVVDFHHSVFPSEESAMLKNILSADDTIIEQIMTHRTDCVISSLKNIKEIYHTINHSVFSEILIGENGDVTGILRKNDVFRVLLNNKNVSENELLHKIKSAVRRPFFVLNTIDVNSLIKSFRNRGSDLQVVTNEYGAFLGVISPQDLLESIVGNLSQCVSIKKKENGYIIEGDTLIRDINNRLLDWNMQEEYITLADMILDNTKQIPAQNSHFTIDGFLFKILQKSGNNIKTIYVEKISQKEE